MLYAAPAAAPFKMCIRDRAEVPTVTGDILNALRTTGKTLCVVGDGYTMQIAGSGVKSTTSAVSYTHLAAG